MNLHLNEWLNDLCGFPYQCYYQFIYNETRYTIYIRWRESDPWTADLITDFEEVDENWVELEIPFLREGQLNEVKKEAINCANMYLEKIDHDRH